jgi:hypothetical protein
MKKADVALALILLMMLLGIFSEFSSANFKSYPYPEVTVVSPTQNGSYNQSNVPFRVKVEMYRHDGQIVFETLAKVKYGLDGQAEVSAIVKNEPRVEQFGAYGGYTGIVNTYLSGLSVGSHTLVIYGETAFAKNSYFPETNFTKTISFTVSSSFPTITVVAVSVVSAMVLANLGLAVYLKRRNHIRESP